MPPIIIEVVSFNGSTWLASAASSNARTVILRFWREFKNVICSIARDPFLLLRILRPECRVTPCRIITRLAELCWPNCSLLFKKIRQQLKRHRYCCRLRYPTPTLKIYGLIKQRLAYVADISVKLFFLKDNPFFLFEK